MDMLNAPFDDIHSLYKIVFLRSEAQKERAKEEERKAKQQELNKNNTRYNTYKPTDEVPKSPSLSNISEDDLEDAIEEMAEGG
mgnify:CR=1 FL=1